MPLVVQSGGTRVGSDGIWRRRMGRGETGGIATERTTLSLSRRRPSTAEVAASDSQAARPRSSRLPGDTIVARLAPNSLGRPDAT